MTNKQLVIAYFLAFLTIAGLFYTYWNLAVTPDIQGGIWFILSCIAAFLIAPFPFHYFSEPNDRAPLVTHILATPLVWVCFLIFIGVLLHHDLSFWVSLISFVGVVVGAIIAHAIFPGTPAMQEAIAAKEAQKKAAAQEEQIAAHEPEALLIPIKIPNQALDAVDYLSEIAGDVVREALRPATLAIGKDKLAVTVRSGLEQAREVVELPTSTIRAFNDTGSVVGVGAQSIAPLLSGAAFGVGLSLAIYLNTDKEAAAMDTGGMIAVFGFITATFAFGFWVWSQIRAGSAVDRIATIKDEHGSVFWVVINDDGLAQLERYAADSDISFARAPDG